MAAWLQILQIICNSTLFYPSFDTHDSPGSVFIWKSKFTIKLSNLPVCNGVYYLFTQLQIDAAMKLKTKIFFGATIVFVHSADCRCTSTWCSEN